MAESLSIEYRTQLAISREETNEGDAATYLRLLNHIEVQRKLLENTKVMEGNIFSGSTSKVIITKEDGSTKEFNGKISMEKVVSESNYKK